MERAKQRKLNSLLRSKMQRAGKMAVLASRTAGAFEDNDDKDDELIDAKDLKQVTLQRRMELEEIFNHFAPDGNLQRQAFYDMVADVMNHDERIAFFAKYVKRARMQRGLEVTKMGLQEGRYTVDWNCFIDMMLPRGYELPPLPDPTLHYTASDDDLWSKYYSRVPPPKIDKNDSRAKKAEREFRAFPRLPRNENAGLTVRVGSSPYGMEASENRALKHHEFAHQEALGKIREAPSAADSAASAAGQPGNFYRFSRALV
jgi:hypothetical protein